MAYTKKRRSKVPKAFTLNQKKIIELAKDAWALTLKEF